MHHLSFKPVQPSLLSGLLSASLPVTVANDAGPGGGYSRVTCSPAALRGSSAVAGGGGTLVTQDARRRQAAAAAAGGVGDRVGTMRLGARYSPPEATRSWRRTLAPWHRRDGGDVEGVVHRLRTEAWLLQILDPDGHV